jgi:hypothetical protein
MNDTLPEISVQFQNMMMRKSGEQRLLMGFSMYDTARKIVCSSIYNKYPEITAGQIKKEIFVRFYGQDFSQSDKEKILSALADY